MAESAQAASQEARRAAEAASSLSRCAAEKSDETARSAHAVAADAVSRTNEIKKLFETSHAESTREIKRFALMAEDALRTAGEALSKARALADTLITRWEAVLIVLAVTGAATMLGLGLTLLIK
jgi:hypothetical protein